MPVIDVIYSSVLLNLTRSLLKKMNCTGTELEKQYVMATEVKNTSFKVIKSSIELMPEIYYTVRVLFLF